MQLSPRLHHYPLPFIEKQKRPRRAAADARVSSARDFKNPFQTLRYTRTKKLVTL